MVDNFVNVNVFRFAIVHNCWQSARHMAQETNKATAPFISKGVSNGPFTVVVYGPEGVGKSSLAAAAPDPFFFDFEGGSNQLDVTRANIKATKQIYEVMEKQSAAHDCATWVFDTADWLEAQFKALICASHRKGNLEEFGFGKGHEYLEQEWKDFIAALDAARGGRNVIFCAHHQVKPYHNPMGDDYDRFQLKLNKRSEALLKEWSSAVLFLNYFTTVRKSDGKVIGMGDGGRMIYTEHRPAYDAKNRYGLPHQFEVDVNYMGWVWDQMASQRVEFDALRDELRRLAGPLSEALRNTALTSIDNVPDNVRDIEAMRKWIEGKLEASK